MTAAERKAAQVATRTYTEIEIKVGEYGENIYRLCERTTKLNPEVKTIKVLASDTVNYTAVFKAGQLKGHPLDDAGCDMETRYFNYNDNRTHFYKTKEAAESFGRIWMKCNPRFAKIGFEVIATRA